MKKYGELTAKERRVLDCEARECLSKSGFGYTMSLIGGKYKMVILYTLKQFGTIRFNALQRYIGGIPYKTLSANLKELAQDGLIMRKEYPEIPPHVEYALTPLGQSLMPMLSDLCAWGYDHNPNSIDVKILKKKHKVN
ncbi:helix-turn-helix domain-containing protein [uncultured Pseudoramibacter sp.]|uniref:winged helix-turn-helix transcriptional regulator n=1 Tax=uncultured Pseudoramibacter sp. TaxID=1623493 RepID=UPI0025CD3FB8|nr:helix-turn-helix domain-containing protein [uncultured Pseudoramibacter sp.]